MGHEKHSKMDVLSSLLRPCLIAAPGKKLCPADPSNTEGRVLGIEMLGVSQRTDKPHEMALELIGV